MKPPETLTVGTTLPRVQGHESYCPVGEEGGWNLLRPPTQPPCPLQAGPSEGLGHSPPPWAH